MRGVLLGVAAGAPLPTTWPAPHNTSAQCVHMLAKHKLDWLLEPFTCTKAQKTSNAHIVLGTGLGGTGTRSVASAVDKLGYPACHSFLYILRLLQMSKPHDLTAFRGGASYFDTPMGYIFPRLLCSFPKAKIVHTTRRDYHRGYDGSSRKCRSKREYRLESDLARCIEYGSTCPTRDEAARAFAVNERAMLSVPKSRRHIMNISDLSSIHAGPLAEFLGKEWRWGNPDKPIPHKAVYYASRACLGGNHPRHWVPRVH